MFKIELITFISVSLMILSLISAIMVIRSQAPLYSVLFLLVLFLCASLVLLLTSNEFLAFIYIIVYVGAVIVLLLWVIMTVPIKPFHTVPITLMLGFIIFAFFVISFIVSIFFVSNVPILYVFQLSSNHELFPLFFNFFIIKNWNYFRIRVLNKMID